MPSHASHTKCLWRLGTEATRLSCQESGYPTNLTDGTKWLSQIPQTTLVMRRLCAWAQYWAQSWNPLGLCYILALTSTGCGCVVVSEEFYIEEILCRLKCFDKQKKILNLSIYLYFASFCAKMRWRVAQTMTPTAAASAGVWDKRTASVPWCLHE